jgi:hypothetical protein
MTRSTLARVATLTIALVALAALWLVIGAPGPTSY